MTRKTFSRISFFIYLAYCVFGFVLGVYCMLNSITPEGTTNDFGEGLGKAIMLILGLICLIYASVAILPTVLKGLDLRFEKNALTVICIIFDILFAAVHAAFVIEAIKGNAEPLAGIISGILLISSILSMVSNILCMKAKY